MQVNLKKAAALSSAVLALGVKFDHSYSVDIYAEPPSQATVDQAHAVLAKQFEAAQKIIQVGFVIRNLIGVANVGRISEMLTTRAEIDKRLTIINSLPVRPRGTNLDAMNRQIEALRVGENKVYGAKAVTLDLETESLVLPWKRQLTRQKRDLEDQLAGLNFNTMIELPAEVVRVLTDLDLI